LEGGGAKVLIKVLLKVLLKVPSAQKETRRRGEEEKQELENLGA
jgi:hypothetical protein